MSARRGPVQSFEDLEVFQKAYRMALEVHRASLTFPAIEQRVLGDQVRRASKSICANIAEGFGKQRNSKLELPSDRPTRCVFGHASVSILISSMKQLGRSGAIVIKTSHANSKRFARNPDGEHPRLIPVFCILSSER